MTTTAPGISVVMPVHNGEQALGRSIASVFSQTYPDWELIAVDRASTDNTPKQLDEFVQSDQRIRLFRHDQDRGSSAARNTALSAARGRLIAYLDPGDEYYPDFLARAHEFRERADVVLFQYDLVEEHAEQPGFVMTIPFDPASRCSEFMFSETISLPLGVVHQRVLIDRVGGFNEDLPHDEDGDLWRRFANGKASFSGVPFKSGRHRVRHDSPARPDPARVPQGLPTPIATAQFMMRGEKHGLRIAAGDAFMVRDIFVKHEYGGISPQFFKSASVIMDIGANVGTFALYAKLHYHREAQVHCFEPYGPNIELLRKNVAPFPGITIHPFGLGTIDGEAELFLHPSNSGANSTFSDLVGKAKGRATIPIRNAGAVWDELGLTEVDLMKIDTEGAEIAILKALGPRLDKVRILMLEYHSNEDRRQIDALLPQHTLVGFHFHNAALGVVKYARQDLFG